MGASVPRYRVNYPFFFRPLWRRMSELLPEAPNRRKGTQDRDPPRRSGPARPPHPARNRRRGLVVFAVERKHENGRVSTQQERLIGTEQLLGGVESCHALLEVPAAECVGSGTGECARCQAVELQGAGPAEQNSSCPTYHVRYFYGSTCDGKTMRTAAPIPPSSESMRPRTNRQGVALTRTMLEERYTEVSTATMATLP